MLVVDPDTPEVEPAPATADTAVLDDSAAVPDAARAGRRADLGRRIWFATWPKVAAIAIGLFLWQLVVWSGWKPEYVLPGPAKVFAELGDLVADGTVGEAVTITLRRAALGFALALAIGVVVGSVVASSRIVRSAVGSLITGIQTMPSIVWFPLAILLFKISEQAIMFVVVLGAAPSIANGLITGVDHVPPILLKAGRAMGARGMSAYRHVVLPASMPSFVGGLKQGWAFAWRSLMAGELLVIIAGSPSVGSLLQNYRNLNNAAGLMAMMIVILVIGIVVDTLFFGTLDRWIRRRHGLLAD
jgi:NitT/TauT family transport system permease protein